MSRLPVRNAMFSGILVIALPIGIAPAVADVVSLRGEAQVGATGGKGVGGDRKAEAFHQKSPHVGYGVLVGAEFLFVDGWIQHRQLTNGSRLTTWTEFGAGLDVELGLAENGAFFEAGMGLAFGLGTGQQVDPPLSNDEITDKGVYLQAFAGVGTQLSRFLDVGVRVPVSAGYYVKSGQGAVANDLSTHYTALHGELLGYLRLRIKAL